MWFNWMLVAILSSAINLGAAREETRGSIVVNDSTGFRYASHAGNWMIPDMNRMARIKLGYSSNGRLIEAWYFPGRSSERAMVLAGMHGSEISAIDVAERLIAGLMDGVQPYYSVLVIPCLFPDNAAMALQFPAELGSVKNIGRYSWANATDPNRQMPAPGRAYQAANGIDCLGRRIEKENQLLLELIQAFRPTRIANLHAIRDRRQGGIYADPRTNHLGIALGFEKDSLLAIEMAKAAWEKGASMQGNGWPQKANTLYYRDPAAVPAGQFQPRSFSGSLGRLQRGKGITLGTWASTAIAWEEDASLNRNAITVITAEFPGSRRPEDYTHETERRSCEVQADAFVYSLRSVFLEDRVLIDHSEMIPVFDQVALHQYNQ